MWNNGQQVSSGSSKKIWKELSNEKGIVVNLNNIAREVVTDKGKKC